MKGFNKILLPLVAFIVFALASCGDNKDKVEDCSKGHDIIVDDAVQATFSSTGLTQGSHCIRCGKVINEQNETPILGSADLCVLTNSFSVKSNYEIINTSLEAYVSLNQYANITAYGNVGDSQFLIEDDVMYVNENGNKFIINRSDSESSYIYIYDIVDSIKNGYELFEMMDIDITELEDGMVPLLNLSEEDILTTSTKIKELLFDIDVYELLMMYIDSEIVDDYIINGAEKIDSLIVLSQIISCNTLFMMIDDELKEIFNLEATQANLYPNIQFALSMLNEYVNDGNVYDIKLDELFDYASYMLGRYSIYDALMMYGLSLDEIKGFFVNNNLVGENSILFTSSLIDIILLLNDSSLLSDDVKIIYDENVSNLAYILSNIKINSIILNNEIKKIVIDANIDAEEFEALGTIEINIDNYNEANELYLNIK